MKPPIQIRCPNCNGALVITWIVPENGQVNLACINSDCWTVGCVYRGDLHFVKRTPDENQVKLKTEDQ